MASEWTMTGTNDGADPQTGLPATGQRFRIAGVTVARMRDDQVAESRVYWNLADYLQQVGLMPAPATSSSGVMAPSAVSSAAVREARSSSSR